ncbi:helix-turn-helix domain-containing protein [Leyella stercorea]|uniref:helix-turn-helix domain-containing protein n=1 Tax=Leyella stercorea TaxID=363265 RepID=UPI003AEF69B2
MKISFIPIRLREARKMCGYSLDQLTKAANVRVTRQSIYNYERGVMQPKPDMVKALAETLGVNESFFYGKSTKIDMPMLRSTGDNMLSEEDLQQLEAMLSYWAERYLLMEKKIGLKSVFSNPLADIKVSTLIIRKTKRFAIPERAVYFLKTKRTAGGAPPPQNIFDRLTPVFT